MMTTAAPHSRGFHFLAAIVSTGAFFVLVNLLPTVAAANDSQLVVKCAAEILFAGLVVAALVALGQPRERLAIGHVRSTLGWGILCAAAAMGHQR